MNFVIKMANTTTITISKTNKIRLEAILKKNETFDFAVSLLLLCFDKPRFNAGDILGRGRTVYPKFSDSEIAEIRSQLEKFATSEPLKTPQEIEKEK